MRGPEGRRLPRRRIDVVFQPHPCDESRTEDEIEQTFVGDCENDEYRRECQENSDQAVKVMIVGVQTM